MPVEIEHLNRILKKLKLKHKNNTIILTEKGKQAILKEIHLTDIHNDYLSLKAERSNFKIFAKGFAGKQCDYIVLSEHNGKKLALFIELKSSIKSKPSQEKLPADKENTEEEYEDFIKQFRGSSCLLDFLHSVLKNFCEITVLNDEYQRYYAVLHNNKLSQINEPIPLTRPVNNNLPEHAHLERVDNKDSIPFHTLLR